MCSAVGVRCLRGEERTPTRRVAARFSHPGRELWLAAGGGSNPRVTMTTGGITRLLLTEGERESGCLPRGGGGTTTMRTTSLAGNEGPVNGLPRTSIRLAEQPVHTYVHARPLGIASAQLRAEGGSINNSLARPSISLPPIRPGRRSPSRLYPATILISYPGKNIGYFFLGTGRDNPYPWKYGIFPEIRVNVKYHKHRSEEFNLGCAF